MKKKTKKNNFYFKKTEGLDDFFKSYVIKIKVIYDRNYLYWFFIEDKT